MGTTKKFIARGTPLPAMDEQGRKVAIGDDEPSILEDALTGQKQSGNYRHDGRSKSKRGTGVRGRERAAARSNKSAQEKRDK